MHFGRWESVNTTTRAIGLPKSRVNAIVKGRRAINTETDLRASLSPPAWLFFA